MKSSGNPYESPRDNTEQASRVVKNTQDLRMFATLGLLSGFLSACSVMVRPLGVFLPGLFFGTLMLAATPRTLKSRPTHAIVFALVTFAAHPIAGILTLGVYNNTRSLGNLAGFLASFVGSFVGTWLVAFAYAHVRGGLRNDNFVMTISIVGIAVGTVVNLISAALENTRVIEHPIDDFMVYIVWQTCVAFSIGWFNKYLSFPESDPPAQPEPGE